APASCSRRIATICVSVKRVFRMGGLLRPFGRRNPQSQLARITGATSPQELHREPSRLRNLFLRAIRGDTPPYDHVAQTTQCHQIGSLPWHGDIVASRLPEGTELIVAV
ncbi:MAG TPA: hypothetical protein VFB22_01785, partial [Candidatus Baltobacteraceae bacterium]|nr:hypothetical protein [Candidatus Baltobacteraceae bacterium]